MQHLLLTDIDDRKVIIPVTDKLFAMTTGDMTYIAYDGNPAEFRVKETPEQIYELMYPAGKMVEVSPILIPSGISAKVGKRPTGFYRVKPTDKNGYEVAEYIAESDLWYRTDTVGAVDSEARFSFIEDKPISFDDLKANKG